MKVHKAKQDRTKATDRKAGESRRTRPGRKTTSDEWKEKRKPKIKLILEDIMSSWDAVTGKQI